MKYTKAQAESLKKKNLNKYSKHNRPMPDVIIKDGYYIIESKINLYK